MKVENFLSCSFSVLSHGQRPYISFCHVNSTHSCLTLVLRCNAFEIRAGFYLFLNFPLALNLSHKLLGGEIFLIIASPQPPGR